VELVASGDTVRTDVDSSGVFVIPLPPDAQADTVTLTFADDAHRFLPSIVRLPPDSLSQPVRLVLVPASWTIRAGAHAGIVIPVRLDAAFRRGGEGGSFFRLSGSNPGERRDAVSWHPDSLPLKVAFRRENRRELPISPADSAACWGVLREVERELGMTLFRPASDRELGVGTNGIAISVNPSIGAEGFTFVSWSSGRVYDAHVSVRTRELLVDHAVLAHELLHALGFGHTSAWRSVMTSPFHRAESPTPEDVAYAQLLYAVRVAQQRERAPYGILEAWNGQRALERSLAATAAAR
jgi:hypothetical protein